MKLQALVLARKREVARPEGAAPKKAPRTRWLDRGAVRGQLGARILLLVDRKHVRAPDQSANSRTPSPTPPLRQLRLDTRNARLRVPAA